MKRSRFCLDMMKAKRTSACGSANNHSRGFESSTVLHVAVRLRGHVAQHKSAVRRFALVVACQPRSPRSRCSDDRSVLPILLRTYVSRSLDKRFGFSQYLARQFSKSLSRLVKVASAAPSGDAASGYV